MGPNPTQYPQMVAGDKRQGEIPPLEEDIQEEDNDKRGPTRGRGLELWKIMTYNMYKILKNV